MALPLHELLLATGGRWLGLLALAVLVGGLVLDCVVLPRHAGELVAARHWLHAVAATAWTGGLLGLALALSPSSELLGTVARRFSRLAAYCLLVVVASGVYNACVQVPTLASLWTTTYGVALLLKVVLALVLAFLGAVNRYLVLPGLGAIRPRPRGRLRRLCRIALCGRLRRLCRIALFGAAAAPGA